MGRQSPVRGEPVISPKAVSCGRPGEDGAFAPLLICTNLQTAPSPAERNGTLTILHTGHVYGPRRIEPLLAALTEWRRIDPELTESVRVRLVGGSSEYVESLRATIQRYQLHACVAAEPEVSHREALRRQSQAAVLLLIGFSGPHGQYQMSGKIFEYLAIGRPILALAPPSCPVGDVLRGAGAHHWIVSPNDEPGLAPGQHDVWPDLWGAEGDAPRARSAESRTESPGMIRPLDASRLARAGAYHPIPARLRHVGS